MTRSGLEGASRQAAAPTNGASAPAERGKRDSVDSPLTPEQKRRASAIARRTMSPFCPGRTLADCPSSSAAEWREEIRLMVREGRSAEEIHGVLEERAGSNLSGSPNRDASYAVPVFFGLLALSVLGAIFLRLRRSSSEQDKTRSRDVEDASRESAPAGSSGSEASKREQLAVDDARLEAELAAEGSELDD